MRRAQFEILGLAVIVIIISLIILFTLIFGLNESDNVTDQFQQEQFAQNTIDALLKTDMEHCRGTVADYLISQKTGRPLRARDATLPTPPRCATEAARIDIAGAIESAMEDYRGRDYCFEVRRDVCDIWGSDCGERIIESGECDYSAETTRAGVQTLSAYPDEPLQIVLWLY